MSVFGDVNAGTKEGAFDRLRGWEADKEFPVCLWFGKWIISFLPHVLLLATGLHFVCDQLTYIFVSLAENV